MKKFLWWKIRLESVISDFLLKSDLWVVQFPYLIYQQLSFIILILYEIFISSQFYFFYYYQKFNIKAPIKYFVKNITYLYITLWIHILIKITSIMYKNALNSSLNISKANKYKKYFVTLHCFFFCGAIVIIYYIKLV